MEVVYLVVSTVLASVVTWAFSRCYYRKSAVDAANSAMAQRLDDCTKGDKTFLIALLDAGKPIPRYALINVEFETRDGRKGSWGSNSLTMLRSVNAHAKHSIRHHSGSHIDEDRETISLSDRGRENAGNLLVHEFRSARFTTIDDNDVQRLAMFRSEHKRDPQKGCTEDSGIVSSSTVEY